jgi:hypothetical protein
LRLAGGEAKVIRGEKKAGAAPPDVFHCGRAGEFDSGRHSNA